MKRTFAALLCMILLCCTLAACGEQSGPKPEINENGKKVITIGIPLRTTVVDYETNAYTLWLEEQLDVDIQFSLFATGGADYKSQFSGMVLKGDKLPDILWNFSSFSGALFDMYGQDKYLVDLKPYMDDKEGASKQWWAQVADLDPTYVANVLKRCEDDYGAMYVFPRLETSVIDTMDYMVSVNQTWLDACNLQQPTNIDEFYNVLVTFKKEMCKNAGYYPLVGGSASMLSGDVVNWIINMFLYFNDATYFNVSEDGKTLTVPFTSDKYREALAFCKKLVDEGLLTTDLAITEVKALVNPADGVPRVGMVCGHPTLTFLSDDPSIDHFVPLQTYWGNAVRTENMNELSAAITTDCADPDLAFRLLMLASSPEGGYRLRYGERGKDWDWADEGAQSYLGIPCAIKVMNATLSTSAQNASWINGPGVLKYAENEAVQYTDEGGWINKKNALSKGIYASFTAAEENNNPKYICPVMVLSEAQSAENEVERDNTRNVVYSMRDCFIRSATSDTILGGAKADINNDKHWKAYLDALESNGLQKWYDQMQQIYTDEYMEIAVKN